MSKKFFYLILSLTLITFLNAANSSVIRKKSNKLSKSNKSNKRQEKSQSVSSKFVNLNEPEFDSSFMNVLSTNQLPLVETTSRIASTVTSNVSVMLGQNVILPCAVRNIGSFKILWLRVKDGDVLAYDDMIITQDARFSLNRKNLNESNLRIQSVKSSDSGEYACQINTQSLKAKLINLVIMTPPSFTDPDGNVKDESLVQYYTNTAWSGTVPNNLINNKHASHLHHNHHNHHKNHHLNNQKYQSHSSTKSVSVAEGKQINMECNAFGIPKPEINWYVKKSHSSVLTEYLLNSSKLTVNNVTRNQYDYFECEATNKIPPSVSKKFKINVIYPPEISLSPSKVFVNSRNSPVQVKFNCSVNSFPESDITWVFMNSNSKKKYELKKNQAIVLSNLTKRYNHQKRDETNQVDDEIDFENDLIITSKEKYSIFFQSINETFKMSSIVIDVENENDLGIYSCYANNSVGSKSAKFYIYGEMNSPETTTVITDLKLKETAEPTNNILINNYQFVSRSKTENYDYKTLQNQNLNKKDLIIEDNIFSISTTPATNVFDPIASTLLNDARKAKETSVLFDSIFKSSSNYSTSSTSSSYFFNYYNFISYSILFFINILMMTIF